MTGSSYTYQWQRCTSNTASSCSDVSGSTSTTYLLGQADTDKFIRAGVSYVDDYSTTETVYSAFTSQIGNINDAPNAGADQTGALTEDASTSTVSNTVGASDPDRRCIVIQRKLVYRYLRNLRGDITRRLDIHPRQQ